MAAAALPALSPRAVLRARLGVILLFFVNGATVGCWVTNIPERARSLGLNPAQLGAVLFAGGIGALAGMPLSSRLTRRYGSRRVSSIAGLAFPCMLVAAVVAPTTPLLVLSLVAFGLAGATNDVSMNAHSLVVERRLGRPTISLFHGLYSAGGMAGSFAASTALAAGVRPGIVACTAAATLVAMILAARAGLLTHAEELRDQAAVAEPASAGGLRARLQLLLPHPRLLELAVLTFAALVSEGAVADWSGLLLRVGHGLGAGVAGYGFTCFSGAMVTGRLAGDRLVARLSPVLVLRGGSALTICGIALVLTTGGLAPALVGFTMVGLGLANAAPLLYPAAGRIPGVPPSQGIATAVGISYFGLLAGPPLLGVVGKHLGLASIFLIIAALCAALAAAAPLIRSPPEKATAV
jgi:predicted MFS family arabinose efflux permease